MKFLIEKENMHRGSSSIHRHVAAGVRCVDPWHTKRTGRRRRTVILTVFFCSVILILVFSTANRHTVQISAPYEQSLRDGTTSTGQDGSGTANSTLFRRLEWKEGQFVLVQYGTEISTELDTSEFIDPSTKNSHDLVEWAKMAWENQWGYVWGTFGSVLTEDLLTSSLKQYPDALDEYENIIREKWMGRRVTDCVGLIKCYGWYEPATGNIEYGYGDMPDVGADGMWDAAEVKGDIDTMPDEPGLLVYSTGHIGVYIGGGYAIEAISHTGSVVKTMVSDRPWTGWLQCPYIRYDF